MGKEVGTKKGHVDVRTRLGMKCGWNLEIRETE